MDGPDSLFTSEIIPLLRLLKTSSTNNKINSIQKLNSLLKLKQTELSEQHLNVICLSILKTYCNNSFNSTFDSLVLQSFSLFLSIDSNKYFKIFTKFIDGLSSKLMAPADLLVLLDWNNYLINYSSSSSTFEKQAQELISSSVNLLNSIATTELLDQLETTNLKKHDRRVIISAEKKVRLGIIASLKKDSNYVKLFIKHICDSKLPISSVLSHIGLLSSAVVFLQQIKSNTSYDIFSENKTSIINFFSKDCLATKIIPQHYSLQTFQFFVLNFVTADDLSKTVFPSLEKAALRNSELTFGNVSPFFFSAINSINVDILQILSKSKFLGQLTAALKSPKEIVRSGSSKTLIAILQKSTKDDEKELSTLLDELFKILKGLTPTAIEQKVLFGKILDAVPKVSLPLISKLLSDLTPIIAKDSNDVSLSALSSTLFDFVFYIFELDQSVEQKVLDLIISGLNQKKQNLRKCWIVSLAKSVLTLTTSTSSANEFFKKISPLLISTLDECVKSPLPSFANKLIAGGYASLSTLISFTTLSSDKSLLDLISEAELKIKVPITVESSILTNERLYIKYVSEDEQEWFVRSLAASSKSLTEISNECGFAWLYSCLSKNIVPSVRRLSVSLLSECNILNQKFISESCVSALTNYLKQSTRDNEELKLNFNHLPPFIFSITNNYNGKLDKFTLEDILVKLLVPSHHTLMKSLKTGWVGICQRTNLDPGQVVSRYSQEIVDFTTEILINADSTTDESGFYEATCSAIALVSFISTDSIIPKIKLVLDSDLNISELQEISDDKIDIWNGVDGELVIDILSKGQKKQTISKNSKDYETLKWEESIRKDVAAKKKSTIKKKLTKEEQSLVNDQLKLETNIRKSVDADYQRLRRSLEIIIALSMEAETVDNGTELWFPTAIASILNILNSDSCKKLVGELSTKCFLRMSHVFTVSGLTGTSNINWIGATTLRLYNIDFVPAEYTGKDLNELVTNQLFSLKLSSDKVRFDSLTLMYILPLLVRVIEIGKNYSLKHKKHKTQVKTDFVQEEPEEEQLDLAIEIISSHCEAFQDDSIPRTAIIENLLTLMTVPNKAKLSKDCFMALSQNISVNSSDSDLQLIISKAIEPTVFVRTAVLEALDNEFDLSEVEFSEELYIACFDNEESNSAIARTIWEESEFELDSNVPHKLIAYLGNKHNGIRLSIGKSVAQSVIDLKSVDTFTQTLNELLELYRVKEKPPAPKTDKFGLVIKSGNENADTWEERSGVALALKYLAPAFNNSAAVEQVFTFLIDERALGDKEEHVRHELLDAGLSIINSKGKANVEVLISIFENGLAVKDEGSKVQDHIKESIIILYGNLARHLDEFDPRIDNIVTRLLKALDTPSEDVQFAVSECIAPLVPVTKTKLSSHFDNLFERLVSGKSLAERRGAAYGISGLVKGAGIKALAENDIIRNLTEASDDKKDPKKREGVSFAFECLAQSLGPLFEPYVIEILPIVLKSLGDQSPEVREATDYAARMIMKNTTSFGVKKLIPLAINNLDDIAWRTKKGSVELLGSMAYLDPTQLSASLPTIVPEIVGVLNDSHKEVRKAADQSLKRFGEVIRNPEIQELVPTLLKAIGDPTRYTTEALDALISTQFVHYIDGPSLALIIHVIHRGMLERSSTTKRKACQIIGNMAILVDSKDLGPYLHQVVSELKTAIVDPVPQTRATAGRALGSLVEKLGEERFPDLIPGLLATLQDEYSIGDKVGSAQALAEIISGLGIRKLDEMLPTIFAGTISKKTHVRAGFMPLLLFLPVCFGNQFSPYISKTISPILNGLADNDEEIRDTALRAGRLIVSNYATKAVDLLLPELERGLSDPNSRIRLSSVELLGDLLFKIGGITGKQELTDDLVSLSNNVNQALLEVLGEERRDHILASLFVCRSDTAGTVRVASVNIWKALVANTPKTAKEILPTLTQIIIRRLASSDEVQRSIAASTLGEMVKRVGGNALSQLVPTLENSVGSSDSDAKQGICIAARELIESSNPTDVNEFHESFVHIIRDTLVDPNPAVREASALAFEVFQDSVGNSAIDEVIPQLLEMLDSTDSDNALSALQEIMATKSDVIFPILIPSLLTPPIKARALGALAQVAGSALFKRLSTIINSLVDGIIVGDKNRGDLINALTGTLLSVDVYEGCHSLMQQILSLMRHEDSKRVAVIYEVLPKFFADSTLDYSVYTHDLLVQCIFALDNEDKVIAKNSFEALSVLVKKQSKDNLDKLVFPTEQTLSLIGKQGEDLYVFTLPKGPNCILPIFLHGLMYGNSQQREISANGIARVVDYTPATALRPFVTVIVGPLIRVIGERFGGDVKSAILLALNKLFAKIPQFLRPFIPQLQRTFVKSLSDPSNELLRTRAAKALGTLIEFQPRVDPLVTELLGGAKAATGAESIGVKTAMLKALLEVVDKAGSKMSENSKNGVMSLVEKEMFSDEATTNTAVAYARLIGALSKILSTDEAAKMMKAKVLDSDLSNSNSSKFAILTLNAFLRDSPQHIVSSGLLNDVVEFIVNALQSPMPYVSDNATVAAGKLLLSLKDVEIDEYNEHSFKDIINQLCLSMSKPISNSSDTRRLSLVVIRTVCRFEYERCISPFINVIAPSVFACVRDPIIPIKLAAEKSFLAIFKLVDDESGKYFKDWVSSESGSTTITTASGAAIQMRSITEYTKRVGHRLADVERERIAAGGDHEAMFSDQIEDEREIWAIGGVDLGKE